MINAPDIEVGILSDSQSRPMNTAEDNDDNTEIPAWHSLSATEIYRHMRQAKA